MNIDDLQEHAAALRAAVQRHGLMSEHDLYEWLGVRNLRNNYDVDQRKLLALAGVAVQITAGEDRPSYVTIPITIIAPIVERRTRQIEEAVTLIRKQLARGQIPRSRLNFPEASFPDITLSEALRAANAATFINVNGESYGLLP